MEAVIFIGLQASGKSTFCRERFYQTHIRLNLDMLKTRHREKLLVAACLQAKQKFVIDNTNPGQADREKYITAAKQYRFETVAYYFAPDVEACLARNRLRTGKDCVPDKAILSTCKKLEKPTRAEGFDRLYQVSIKNGTFIVEEFDEV